MRRKSVVLGVKFHCPMERKVNSMGLPTHYPGEVELKEIHANEEGLNEDDFVSGNEQSKKFISFSVKVTDRNLGFTIQEDVLGLDEGLYVGTVDRNGPLSSSQILEGDELVKIGDEDVTHLE